MKQPKLIAFDLDDTLAPSKSRIDPVMADLLCRLLHVVPVCIISGGRFEQFSMQVLTSIEKSSNLSNLHLMPTCGTQYFVRADRKWSQVYSEDLTEPEKDSVIKALTDGAIELGLWEKNTWGPIIEDRGSQITFSALGQEAPISVKQEWDPTGTKKELLRSHVAAKVPGLEVRSGGSTSVDITRKGIDKSYGMDRIKDRLGLGNEDVLFVGDRLDEGGNDYPVKVMGIRCIAVEEWEHTAIVIRGLLATVGAVLPATGMMAGSLR